jgi:hypothetical protein
MRRRPAAASILDVLPGRVVDALARVAPLGRWLVSDAWLDNIPYDECLSLLRASSVGRVAVTMEDMSALFPANYRLVETSRFTWLAIRTRPGNVIDRAPMHVALEMDNIDSLHHQGWAVLVRGTHHHVAPDAADFRDRFDPHPWLIDERDAWLVIQPFTISGRRLHATEREWAFHLGAYFVPRTA